MHSFWKKRCLAELCNRLLGPGTRLLVGILLVGFFTRPLFGQATEESIRAAILGTQSFTQQELQQLDLNTDGKVDVADLVFLGVAIPTIQFATTSSSFNEDAGPIQLGLLISGAASEEPVNYTLGGSAQADVDYFDPGFGQVTVSTGAGVLPLQLIADTDFEGGETIKISLLPNEIVFLGENTSHEITILESNSTTVADYVFYLDRDLPGGFDSIGIPQGLFSRKLYLSLVFSNGSVVQAFINELKSTGIQDSSTGSDTIDVKQGTLAHVGGVLSAVFEYDVSSEDFSTSATINSFNFDPDVSDGLPTATFPEEVPALVTESLTIEVSGVDLATNSTYEQLTGSFLLVRRGITSGDQLAENSGVMTGSLQPLGVAR